MDNKFTKYVILGFLVIFMIIFAINISGDNIVYFFRALGAQTFFASFAYLIYSSRDYFKEALPIFNKKTFGFSILIGISFGLAYVFLTRLIPGLSVGITLVPQSISSDMQWFIVNIVAPIMESILAFGAILVVIKKTNLGKNYPYIIVFIIGALMAFLHLGAYVIGIANLNFSQAVGAFTGNLGAFISAFIFFTLSGFLVVWKKTRCLIVAIIPHFIVNFTNFVKAVALFAMVLGVK